MGKLLFIEANTTGTGMIAIQKAKEVNLEPVFLTNNPDRYTDLKNQGCEIILCNTNNISNIKATIDNYFKINEVEGITTTSEFYIYTVSILNEIYNLNGNPSNVIKRVRNKATVRDQLKYSKILYQPKYFVIESIQSLIEIKDNLPFPCIAKPVDDSGSNGVLKCNNFDKLKQHVQELLSVKKNVRDQERVSLVLIEEWVKGQEYSIETFSYKGSHQIIGITMKIMDKGPFFVETGHVFPAFDIDSNSSTVRDSVQEILNLLDWDTGPAHIEIKIKDNKLFLVEFNGRLAGGMIPILIEHATGLDLVKEQVKAAADIQPCLDNSLQQCAGIRFLISNQSGVVAKITGMNCTVTPEIKEMKCKVDIGEKVEKTTNAYGRLGHIIAVSSDNEKLMKILNDSMNQIKIEMEGNVLS